MSPLSIGQISQQVTSGWRRLHPSFPQPVATLSAGLVWAWPDVMAWAKATGRTIVGEG